MKISTNQNINVIKMKLSPHHKLIQKASPRRQYCISGGAQYNQFFISFLACILSIIAIIYLKVTSFRLQKSNRYQKAAHGAIASAYLKFQKYEAHKISRVIIMAFCAPGVKRLICISCCITSTNFR